jgi:hypothetical protein
MSMMTRKAAAGHVTPTQILSSQIVGAVFSTVLAFFFAGGLIEGALFPSPLKGSWFIIAYQPTEFFKLLVWSFLGGFSERLAPQIFAAFSTRIQQEAPRENSNKGTETNA